jgi:hypothetical protein
VPWSEYDTRRVVIDYNKEASSPLLKNGECKSVGEVTLCDAMFEPNNGSFVATAQLVIALHKGAPYELRWHEGAKKKKRTVRPGALHISPVGVTTYMEWGDAQPEILALAIEQTMVLRIVDRGVREGNKRQQ